MSYSRVFSPSIVIRFDVFKDTGLSPAPSHIPFSVNEFHFQGVKEALCNSVIITVGPAPHATAESVAPEQSLIAF